MQETKQKYRYYKILDLPVDTVVAKKDGLEMTLEEVDIDTLLAEEREKTRECKHKNTGNCLACYNERITKSEDDIVRDKWEEEVINLITKDK